MIQTIIKCNVAQKMPIFCLMNERQRFYRLTFWICMRKKNIFCLVDRRRATCRCLPHIVCLLTIFCVCCLVRLMCNLLLLLHFWNEFNFHFFFVFKIHKKNKFFKCKFELKCDIKGRVRNKAQKSFMQIIRPRISSHASLTTD